MVTVTSFKEREGKDGKNYAVLELSGEMEIVFSKETGRPYITARRTIIPATFPAEMCKNLIGKQIPGSIKKVQTEKYEYTLPESGKVIELSYRWEYSKDEDNFEAAILGSDVAHENTLIKSRK